MFTGLIRDIGTITDVSRTETDSTITIATSLPVNDLEIGASIACDGVCLTVIAYKDGEFSVQAAAETMAVTNVGQWRIGQGVNLEPSLRLGDLMGGHIVSGHVDGIAHVRSVAALGDGYRLVIAMPPALHKYVSVKGSIALNGISLTINEVGDDWFSILIIPHTWAHTTMRDLGEGDAIHVEVDPMARYVERLLESRL